ncbi:MAG: Binding-protein-dependent transport system inner rane component [Frondihabitans sp.]|nr:Binding-protein-dependent transport system inner rane component [Frondihabitans sp.]
MTVHANPGSQTLTLRLSFRGLTTRLRRDWKAILPLLPAILLVLVTVLSPFIERFNPQQVSGNARLAPNATYWFGTDSVGFDIFSRTIAAFRVDMLIALLVTVAATALGLALGIVIGTRESERSVFGWAARTFTRGVDLVEAIPSVIFGVVVAGLFGANAVSLSIALTFVLLQNQFRLTRVEVLKVRTDAYLDAARMAGQSDARILFRHVLPNSCQPALVNASLIFGNSIVILASLGFLGVGLHPPTPEWGSMISTSLSDLMLGRWWGAIFPAIALCLTVIVAGTASRAIRRLASV